MSKVSVLYKPSAKSWISSDLNYMWYYDINYRDIYKEDLNKYNKIIISKTKYEDLGNLYDYLKWFDITAIIMVSISNLFE